MIRYRNLKYAATAILVVIFHGMTLAQGQLDPVRLNSLTIHASTGPGIPYFGNGAGFGPSIKGVAEKGMWDLGPGVVTLGGEATLSFFSHHFGQNWNEWWFNMIFGARAAYHYGWNIEGLDTYGGLPLGIGFSIHGVDDHPGSLGNTPVYPYAGIFFGTTYFFNHTFGVNGEVGFNSTYASIGVVMKVK